jgi:hypothetical protein
MKTRKTALLGTLITMMILAVGCGSASAPPVDLPAPITGRIDVSSPDENGDVTVTGTEGAVTGGTIVMVENGSESGSASMMIYDWLVPSAHAQDFPAICDQAGYACSYSEQDGSFQVVIPGSVGDTLIIGIINENGEWRSDTVTVVVPESGTPDPEANCAGEGVTGAVVDLKMSATDGIPVMLKQGSDTTTNQLVIGATIPTTVAITGCHAHSIAFYPSSTGDSIAVTSQDDKILWAGRFVSGEVRDARSFTLDYEPMHIAFADLSTQPIVAIRKTDNTVRMARMSTSEGVILSEMILDLDPPSLNEVTGVTRSTAIDVIPMGGDFGHYIGLLIVDNGNPVNSYLSLFQANGIIHKGTWSRASLSTASPIGAVSSLVDGIFYVHDAGISEYFVRLAIIDSALAENVLIEYEIEIDILLPIPLPWEYDISTINTFVTPKAVVKGAPDVAPAVPLQKLARVKPPLVVPLAVITNANGQLYEQVLGSFSAPVAKWLADWALGDDIVAIDTKPANMTLFGADDTADAIIDGSSYPTW